MGDIKIEENFEKFSPREYLEEYYSHIGSENDSLLRFFKDVYEIIPSEVMILEFGGGPTVYQLITGATKAKFIYFSDYLELNLNEVKKWKNNNNDAFDWSDYIKRALEIEGVPYVAKRQIDERAELLRQKITHFIHCDAFQNDPLGKQYRDFFDVVSVNFVPESISKNKQQWQQAMINICSLVKPGGVFIMTALKGANYWHNGNKKFAAAYIDENDVEDVLKDNGFKQETIKISVSPAETLNEDGKGAQGFQGIIFVFAQK